MPGDQEQQDDISEIKADVKQIKDLLLNPDEGLFRRVAVNTLARQIGTAILVILATGLVALAVKVLAG